MDAEIKKELELIEKTGAPKPRLQRLLDLSLRIYRNESRLALKLANEALLLAQDLKDKTAEAKSLLRIGSASFQLAEYSDALKALKRAEAIYKKLGDERGLAGVLQAMGGIRAEMGELLAALKLFERSRDIRSKNQLWLPTSDTLVEMGIVSFRVGRYAQALEHYYEALAILASTSEVLRRSIILGNIGSVYLEIGDRDKALRFSLESLALATQEQDSAQIAVVQMNLGTIYEQQGRIVLAKKAFQVCSKLARELGSKPMEVGALERTAQLGALQGNHKLAVKLYDEAATLAAKFGLSGFEAECKLGKASGLLQSKQFKEAAKLYQEVIVLVERERPLRLLSEAFAGLAKAGVGVGDLKAAVTSYDKFIAINGELNSLEHQRAIAEVQVRLEIEKADKERERFERESTELKQSVEESSKELTALALQIVEKNEFLADLREEITPAVSSSTEANRLINRINEHIQSDQDWETFEDQFKKVHSEFLQKLAGKFPDVTPTELKICALMKLNLSSKEIANLFCLSIRTVENHRQRIRKKLGLTNEDNLVSYLSSL